MTVSSIRSRQCQEATLRDPVRRTEATRRRILDASAALVAERGVRGVSFREVARHAGVSHQAPYHHFGDHGGILRALATEGFTALSASMQAATARHDDPLDRIEAAGRAYVAFGAAHPGHFRVMFDKELVALDDPEHPVDEAHKTFEVLSELCRDLAAAGLGRGLPATALTMLCWAQVHGLAQLQVEGLLDHKTAGGLEAIDPGPIVAALRHLLAAPA